jgi:hypothetical protein
MVEISQIEFIDYNFDDGAWVLDETWSYLMDGLGTNPPPPEEVQKGVKTEWRLRHSGKSNLKRKYWRHRRTETLNIRGKLQFGLNSDQQRLDMEAMATRNSLYKIIITEAGKQTLRSTQIKTISGNSKDYGSDIPVVLEDGLYIITNCSFTLPKGKKHLEYSLTLERVNP